MTTLTPEQRKEQEVERMAEKLKEVHSSASWNPTAEPDVEAWRAGLKKRDAEYCYSMADAMIAERKKHE